MSPFVHQHTIKVFAEYSVYCLALPAGASNTCVQSGVYPENWHNKANNGVNIY